MISWFIIELDLDKNKICKIKIRKIIFPLNKDKTRLTQKAMNVYFRRLSLRLHNARGEAYKQIALNVALMVKTFCCYCVLYELLEIYDYIELKGNISAPIGALK